MYRVKIKESVSDLQFLKDNGIYKRTLGFISNIQYKQIINYVGGDSYE